MKKDLALFLLVSMLVGAILFFDQIKAVFAGMTPLESMRLIAQFILHAAVAAIAGYIIFGLPEIVKPWVRLLRRRWKSGPNARWSRSETPTPRTPRLTAEQKFMLLLAQMNNGKRPASRLSSSTGSSSAHGDDEIRLNL